MLRFIFSLIVFGTAFSLHAQEQDTARAKQKSGLRIGVDLARYVYQIFEPDATGIEVLAQYELRPNIFIALEGGYEKVDTDLSGLSYELSGSYFRLGADYNLLSSQKDYDMVFIGLRYGFSFYRQEPFSVPLTGYWGSQIIDLEAEELHAQWLEAVAGVNAELFFAPNFYAGWTLRAKFFTNGNQYRVVTPYSIPGFAGADKKFALGVTWSLMYRIPVP